MTTVLDPSEAVQLGVYDRLTADAELAGLAGVFDEVPEDHNGDYVVIGEALSTAKSAHKRHGRQVALTLHTWTEARGTRPGNRIGARLVALLASRQAELSPLVPGHAVWLVKWEFHQNLRDPSRREWRHRIDRFRVYTEQEG